MLIAMRTTLNLDYGVVETARALAARDGESLGAVVSKLIRQAVEPPAAAPTERNGIPLFPISHGARQVTPEIVKELLEEQS